MRLVNFANEDVNEWEINVNQALPAPLTLIKRKYYTDGDGVAVKCDHFREVQ